MLDSYPRLMVNQWRELCIEYLNWNLLQRSDAFIVPFSIFKNLTNQLIRRNHITIRFF